MRSDTLLLLHVLAAMFLVGGLIAAGVVSLAVSRADTSGPVRRLVWWSALVVLGGAVATVALGEATRAREDLDATWLDVGSNLAYAGLVLPSLALTVLGYFATTHRRLAPWAAALAFVMIAVALVTAFVMAAKPW